MRFGLDDDSDSDEEPLARGSTPDKQQIEEAELYEDEDLGMDDAAVVSDVEMEQSSGDEVLRGAEAAYDNIFETITGSPPKEDVEMGVDGEEEEEEEDFEDGCLVEEMTPSIPNRIRTTKEDYELAASLYSGSGFTSKIASRVFSGERRAAPSSIDYGLRMGRSFRVGWSPDGSFLKLSKGSGTKLQKFRPVFSDPSALDGPGEKLLEIHKANSRKLATSVDDGTSRFVLPVAIGNEGDSPSHEALRKTIATYSAKGSEIGNQAFSLLSCFVDNEDSVETNEPNSTRLDSIVKDCQFQARRKEAVERFLVQACRATVDREVEAATSRGDAYAAMLAALTGGALEKACDLAFGNDLEELGSVIATFDSVGLDDLRVAATCAPTKVRPIYQLLSGDVRAAGDLDWMRALLVRMMYEQPNHADIGLPQILQTFNEQVAASAAPFPSPNYTSGKNPQAQSILYRLLRIAEAPQTISLSEIVDTDGVSRYFHDFSLAFHLSSAIYAIGISGPMSPSEEARLIDGYCAQLISSGRWEWAAYVCLCALNPESMSSTATDWKRNKAKEIILRNFHSQSAPGFLQQVGVPKQWLFKALALRQGKMGDPFQYIGNVAAYDPVQASAVVDEIILPNLLFMNKDDLEKSIALLESFQGALSPLSMAILNLRELTKDLHALLMAPRSEAVEHLAEIKKDLTEVETTLQARRAEGETKDTGALKFCAPFETIPMASMLHEALEHCVLLRLQLKALELGIEINGKDLSSKKNLTTLLAFHTVDGYDETFTNADVMRALR